MSLKLKKEAGGEKSPKQKTKLNHKKFSETISRKHIKNGSYSMGISAVFIASVVMVNMIVGAVPSKYTQVDVSDQKLYSIGDQTKEMLKNLDKDVTIYQIAGSGSEDETITNLLQRYQDESKHIKVETKDPVVNPKFTSEYTSDNLPANSLIVVCGERNKVIDYNNIYQSSIDYETYSYQTTGFDGEGQITSAVSYVTSDDLPVLYTLEGHGEKELDSTFKEDIEKGNIQIKSLNLLTEGSVPEDADCLLVNSPSTDFSDDEKKAVLDYLENGGKAMIFSDYTDQDMKNFQAVLENYGISTCDGIVMEGDSQHYAMQTPYYLVPDIGSAEAVSSVSSSGYYVLAPFAQGIIKSEELRDTVTIESLLTTSDSAYSKANVTDGATTEKEDGDTDGPFDLGVSIKESLDGDKETQIIYYTTANLLDSQVNQMVSGGNEQLVMASLNWMTDTENSTSVSVPSKNLQVSYLTLTDYDASFWKICTTVLIPGVFLIAGFMIWFKRRKA